MGTINATQTWFRQMLSLAIILAGVGPLVAMIPPVAAAADDTAHQRVAALEAEVKVLKSQVAALQNLIPSFTGFMPSFSERFHVLHRAGEAGDWAAAAHEVLELKRLVGVAKIVDPQKGALFATFMEPALASVEAAVEHGNKKTFLKVMKDTVSTCNTCHTAAGSAFIRVSLDDDKIISIRHAHILLSSRIMGTHKHSP